MRPAFVEGNPVMAGAWVSFVHWASHEPKIVAHFQVDTGMKLPAQRSVLERMIDDACEHDAHADGWAGPFVEWVTKTYWGDEDDEEFSP